MAFLTFTFAIHSFSNTSEDIRSIKSQCNSMILKLDEDTCYLSKAINSLSQQNKNLKTDIINALRIAPASSELDDFFKITFSGMSYLKKLGFQIEDGDVLVLMLITLLISSNNSIPLLIRSIDDACKQFMVLFDKQASKIIIAIEPRTSPGSVIKILIGNRLGKPHLVYKGLDYENLETSCPMDLQPEQNFLDISYLLLVVRLGNLEKPILSDNDWCSQKPNDPLCRLSTRWSLMTESQKKGRLIDVANSFNLLSVQETVEKNSIDKLCDRFKIEASAINDRIDYELESYKILSPHIFSFLENGITVLKNYCFILRERGQEL